MRYCLVRRDDSVQLDRLKAAGMDGVYLDPLDPKTAWARVSELASAGWAVGLYGAWNWAEVGTTGAEFAEWMHEQVKRVTPAVSPSPTLPRVQFDIEAHEPAYVMECLATWRRLEPNRATSWTMEPMQGGWMAPAFVQTVLAARVRVSPQFYGGPAMTPYAADRVMFDLQRAGFPRPVLSGMYDAAALPLWWDGFAFIQDRLP